MLRGRSVLEPKSQCFGDDGRSCTYVGRESLGPSKLFVFTSQMASISDILLVNSSSK